MARNIDPAKLQALDNLGTSKTEFDTEQKLDAIEKACGDFIKRIHENLQSEDAIVSGEIADIQLQRTEDGVEIHANPWLVYQDKGVNGAVEKRYNTPFEYKGMRPPIQPFIDWVRARNIQTRNNEKYSRKPQSFQGADNQKEIESIAYAIRENVYKFGIKPQNVYTKEISKLVEDVKQSVIDFSIEQIKEQFKSK